MPQRRIVRAPYAILAAALLLTATALAAIATGARVRDEVRFENAVQATRDRIVSRLEVYTTLLRAGSGLFAADSALDARSFRAFSERVGIRANYPGIQGIGYTRVIAPADVERVAAMMRAQGFADFTVWPAQPARDELHAILYLEPLDERNRAAIGYDMMSHPVRGEAMQRARDTATPALSARVTLVQELDPAGQQAGFLLYVPVYATGAAPPTVEERRAALSGFVYAPFRADDLFSGIFGTEAEPRVAFEVYDGAHVDPDALLHDSRAQGIAPIDAADLTETVQLLIAGRPWTIRFAPTQGLLAGSRSGMLPFVAVLGLTLSGVLFVIARAQAQARLAAERNARAAAEANRAKSQFLAAMSHELRTPLNAIAGFVDLILLGMRGPVTEQQRRDLERIQHNQQHLLGLINDVLNFAKIEAGSVAYQLCEVDARVVIREAEAMVAGLAEARGVALLDGPRNGHALVVADREKLLQILLNLLSNALKFTPEGGEVRIGWHRGDPTFAIEVADTGRGIPASQTERIFEPFVQLSPDLTRDAQGTGLGLAISRQLARGMGGELKVRSAPGEGSTFTVELPAPEVPEPTGAAADVPPT